ncbi:glycosyl hydrolase 53 family protein, partial [Bacteroides reticulotermitis]
MKRFKYMILTASALLCGAFFTACDDNDDKPVFPESPDKEYDMSGFVRGADVSWLTEMEKKSYKFYDAEGNSQECMSLLRDLGMNAIRLRVWVNPEQGW